MNRFDSNFSVRKKDVFKTLLTTKKFADCCFVVERVELESHKLILALSSPVFESMFYGNLSSDRIYIEDIALDDFKQMLEFIYTDNVKITSVANAWSLFYIAQKYFLDDFIRFCTDYIEKNFSVSTLVLSYEYAEIYNLKEMMNKCLQTICDYVRAVFLDKKYHMKPSTLATILQQPTLNIEAKEIMMFLLKWAVSECDFRHIPASPENTFAVLKELPFLNNLDLSKTTKNQQIDTNEFSDIENVVLEELQANRKLNTIYKTAHWSTFCRLRETLKIAKRFGLNENNEFNTVIVPNKNIYLFGLLVASKDDNRSGADDPPIDEYNSEIIISISIAAPVELLITKTNYVGVMPYEMSCYIPLKDLFVLEANLPYCVTIEYKSSGYSSDTILTHHHSCNVVDKKTNTTVNMYDIGGSILKGICFYPV